MDMKNETWVDGQWDRNFPRRVKMVKGDNVLIGTLDIVARDDTIFSDYMMTLDGVGALVKVPEPGLWKLYNSLVVPTIPGAYKGSTGSLWVLGHDGTWYDFSAWNGYKHPFGPALYLPLVPLLLSEPEDFE